MFPEVNAVAEWFLKNPTKTAHIREIARLTGFSPAGALKALKKLIKQDLVFEMRTKVVTNYQAKRESPKWLPIKRAYNFYSLYASGVVEELVKAYEEPDAIVLFGSYTQGNDTEKSDIDLAIVTSLEKTPDLSKFEKVLMRKINILELDMSKAKKEFLNNLANGIVLHGYLTLIP